MTEARKALDVRFENVTKRYGEAVAVRDVSFSVAPGTLVTLLGPSGCGKTTTLRMIAGLEQPSEGRVLIGGRDVTGMPPAERDVSMVFQSYALFPHMTVLENVRYGLVVSGRRKRDANEAALAALAQVGLEGFGNRLPSELSGGQQQRVAVARALVLQPGVMLFDEPLSNLDARLRRHMREEIRALQQRLGLTVVYVTHDQSEALAISDEIIVMNNAVIAQQGGPRDLYERPASAFVAGFIGESNRLAARLEQRGPEEGTVVLGSARVVLPHHGAAEGAITLAVRPEAVRLVPVADPAAALAGTVTAAAYLGATMEYLVDSEAGEVFIVCPETGSPRKVGDQVALAVRPQGLCVLAA
ncbi:ABC transporter ATP-binding protein [Elioraea rosea]|uniref:ABC transporter ATP-binding protein n=1 Tax=Elioraea rosea TaxID=2492390 RepID=UPI0011828E39|nr:ABC transporter ATP-binding protein [Elioraea rosea]